MPNPTLPEPPSADALEREGVAGAPEFAPSQLARDEPSFARTLGLAGLVLAIFGATVVLFNEISGPRFINKAWGVFAFVVGMVLMLYHAVRDGNVEVRRLYGVLGGFGLVGVAGVVTLMNRELFASYGAASLFGALCFLLAFSRHEDDPFWRRLVSGVLLTLGGVQAVLAFASGLFFPEFLIGPGAVMGVLGLMYLCGAAAQFPAESEGRRRVAWAMVVPGLVALYFVFRLSAAVFGSGSAGNPLLVPAGLTALLLGALYAAAGAGELSDNRTVVMTRRELAAYFYSPVAYLVLLGMAFILGVNYYFFLTRVESRPIPEPILLVYGFGLFTVFGPMIVVPAVTMRLFAEEKRSGTYEVLLCAPVNETPVVLSKFMAGLVFFMLLWVPAGLYLIALRVEGGRPFDYRPLLSFYVALAFSGGAFVAMGLFFSSLTRNQIIAFVMTFVFMLLQVLFYLMRESPSVNPLWQAVFLHLGYLSLWEESLSGRLPLRDLLLQASLCVFWLFLTVRVLEARRWS